MEQAITSNLWTRRKFLISFLLFGLSVNELKAVDIMGVKYISVAQVAKYCGMSLRTVYKNKIVNIYSKYSKVDFEVHQKDIYVNGYRIYLGFPVALASGQLHIALSDYYKNISALLFPKKSKYDIALRHIVIDAGHGGKDFGASNKKLGLYEKTLALEMAFKVGRLLQAKGYRVSYTRSKDTYISLDYRHQYANKVGGDMFVSIHYNATTSTSVSGVETFSMTPQGQYSTVNSKITPSCKKFYISNRYDEWSKLLGFYINMSLRNYTKAIDRGAKNARFAVLTGINMPGVLVECGFLTNYAEASRIRTTAYKDKIARGIVAGITKYQTTKNRVYR